MDFSAFRFILDHRVASSLVLSSTVLVISLAKDVLQGRQTSGSSRAWTTIGILLILNSLQWGPLLFAGAYSTSSRVATAIGAIAFVAVFYNLIYGIYNIYFHPLAKFPGPKLAAVSQIYHTFYLVRGEQPRMYAKLHQRYGDIVRFAPNSLSFIDESAWRDIYMLRNPQMQMTLRARRLNGAYSMIGAPDEAHARQRKALSHAFSEKALREQEPLIKVYMDLLVENIRQDAKASSGTNVAAEFNYLTFDIIGDLAFASPFNALKDRKAHPWMDTLFKSIKEGNLFMGLAKFPLLVPFLVLFSKSLGKASNERLSYTRAKVKERLAQGTQRPDFIELVTKNNDFKDTSKGMTRDEVDITFNTLMTAGSETTATLLSGCMYLLTRNERVMDELKKEVREAFASAGEINVVKVNQLPYLLAVIEESLRIYPPAPIPFTRLTPAEGATICGQWVPGKTVVGVPQVAANRSPLNFTSPNEFLPERFLPDADERFAKDRRAVLQPFSVGPRNCLGVNLAHSEMRLALCRVVFDFDFELVDKEHDWFDQKAWALWDRKPLMIRFKERSG